MLICPSCSAAASHFVPFVFFCFADRPVRHEGKGGRAALKQLLPRDKDHANGFPVPHWIFPAPLPAVGQGITAKPQSAAALQATADTCQRSTAATVHVDKLTVPMWMFVV